MRRDCDVGTHGWGLTCLQAGLPPLHAVPVGKAKALLLDRQCNVPFFREMHKVGTYCVNELLLEMTARGRQTLELVLNRHQRESHFVHFPHGAPSAATVATT